MRNLHTEHGVTQVPLLGTVGPDRPLSSLSDDSGHPPGSRLQLPWARNVLRSYGATPYRIAIACRVILQLSTDASERAVAHRALRDAQADMDAANGAKIEQLRLRRWQIATWVVIVAAMLVAFGWSIWP